MTQLIANSTPAERARHCSFAERFKTGAAVTDNGGTATGSPTISNGVTLDGSTQYITYGLRGHEFDSADISIVIEFWPDFDTDDNNTTYLFDTKLNERYAVFKNNNAASNTLAIWLGNTSIGAIAEATYSPYWLVKQRNVLVISGTSGDTSVWLNGTIIMTSDATAWTPDETDELYIGCNVALSGKFDGQIKDFRVFNFALDANDVDAFYNQNMYSYRKHAVVDLPMLSAQHDATNGRTLDVSGSRNHASFGAGAATPTKRTERGYDFDGGDYASTSVVPPSVGSLYCLFANDGSSGYAAFGGSIQTNNVDNCYFLLRVSTGLVCGGIGTHSYTTITGGPSVLYGVHSAIITWDGTTVTLYVDGSVAYSGSQSGNTNTTQGVYFGALNLAGSAANQFTGCIFCSGLVNRALSSVQAQDLHLRMMRAINNV